MFYVYALSSVLFSKDFVIGVFIFSSAAKEDELWGHFSECGKVADVRLVRDSQTGMGKGFGYVRFQVCNLGSSECVGQYRPSSNLGIGEPLKLFTVGVQYHPSF